MHTQVSKLEGREGGPITGTQLLQILQQLKSRDYWIVFWELLFLWSGLWACDAVRRSGPWCWASSTSPYPSEAGSGASTSLTFKYFTHIPFPWDYPFAILSVTHLELTGISCPEIGWNPMARNCISKWDNRICLAWEKGKKATRQS
jgi:hypothetical protein